APMDALYVALYFYDLDKGLTESLFSKMQFAMGYTIDGVGQIKAQVITSRSYKSAIVVKEVYGWTDDDNDPKTAPSWGSADVATEVVSNEVDKTQAKIEVAFNYTGVENLFVEAGFAMTTEKKLDPAETKKIALYAKYNMDAITLHLSSINNLIKVVDTEVVYKVIAGVDYDLGDGVGVEADVSYNGTTIDDVDGIVTFFAGAKKGFSNGLIGAGVQVKNDGSDTYFGIPIRMEYWF
ncbi:MAG TPA: hypothetical protein PKW72_12270, partial [Treponemataceae bacterium]|nr:hypothetical protein [Treponemataceae bacterium]